MGQDPGLSLALGSVPVNLTNMTQAYGVFAAAGHAAPGRPRSCEIRDRNNRRHLHADEQRARGDPADDPGRGVPDPLDPGGQHQPRDATCCGARAPSCSTRTAQRRHAGFKTGTTNDFRDVSGFGYVPGSLVTGVWMGNNNQEPLSNVLGQGLFSADGPLYLWHDFMEIALNHPWDWNGKQAGAADRFRASRPA